jgi:threonine dehydratase
MLDVKEEILRAEDRIRPYIRETPLEYSFYLSELSGLNVYLKLENMQFTGSFKARGAMNKLQSLRPAERENGVFAASTGNHGMAVAHAAKELGIRGTIYLPENASPQKIEKLKYYGVKLKFYGQDCVETELHARSESEKQGAIYVSPYNDSKVVGGQGTVAVELLRQLDRVDHTFVSVGGGGLISGIGALLKAENTQSKVIGCLPKNSPVMYESIEAGHVVDIPVLDTLSDGTAGGMESDSITFDLCKRYVDDWILVDEDEIKNAMKLIFDRHRLVIEGSAGVTVASFLQRLDQFKWKKDDNVVLIICGGNVDINTFRQIVL